MRLLLVSTEFPPGPGGIGTHASQLARHLTMMGWQVAVLASQDYASLSEIERFNREQPFPIYRARHYPAACLDGLARLVQLSKLLSRFSPEIVLASGSQSVWLVAAARLFHHFTWAVIGHGTEFAGRSFDRRLMRLSASRASAVIAVSRYTLERIHQAGIHPRRELVIHNGAEPAQFYPLPEEARLAFRYQHGIDAYAPLLLTVGNLTERKGQEIVIRALPHILRQFPNAQYYMAGLPTDRSKLEALAASLGVLDHTCFLGRLDAGSLLAALNACDLFVMTSRNTGDGDFEGYGIAAIEAALCGKACVAAAGSGLQEAVQDGVTGILVPQNDPDSTAAAILSLLRDPARRLAMGAAARRRALDQQAWEQVAHAYDGFLRSLLPGLAQEPVLAPPEPDKKHEITA